MPKPFDWLVPAAVASVLAVGVGLFLYVLEKRRKEKARQERIKAAEAKAMATLNSLLPSVSLGGYGWLDVIRRLKLAFPEVGGSTVQLAQWLSNTPAISRGLAELRRLLTTFGDPAQPIQELSFYINREMNHRINILDNPKPEYGRSERGGYYRTLRTQLQALRPLRERFDAECPLVGDRMNDLIAKSVGAIIKGEEWQSRLIQEWPGLFRGFQAIAEQVKEATMLNEHGHIIRVPPEWLEK